MKRFLSMLPVVLLLCGLWSLPAAAASDAPAAAKVTTGTANLNVRASASTSASIVSKLPDGTWVTLLEKSGNWWKIRYGASATGYCYASYLAVRESSFRTTVSAGGSNLNVRKGAGTGYDDQIARRYGGRGTVAVERLEPYFV